LYVSTGSTARKRAVDLENAYNRPYRIVFAEIFTPPNEADALQIESGVMDRTGVFNEPAPGASK
jgi:hypothetical protein